MLVGGNAPPRSGDQKRPGGLPEAAGWFRDARMQTILSGLRKVVVVPTGLVVAGGPGKHRRPSRTAGQGELEPCWVTSAGVFWWRSVPRLLVERIAGLVRGWRLPSWCERSSRSEKTQSRILGNSAMNCGGWDSPVGLSNYWLNLTGPRYAPPRRLAMLR